MSRREICDKHFTCKQQMMCDDLLPALWPRCRTESCLFFTGTDGAMPHFTDISDDEMPGMRRELAARRALSRNLKPTVDTSMAASSTVGYGGGAEGYTEILRYGVGYGGAAVIAQEAANVAKVPQNAQRATLEAQDVQAAQQDQAIAAAKQA